MVDFATGEWVTIAPESNGTGSVKLEPGEYGIVNEMLVEKDNVSRLVVSLDSLTVTNESVEMYGIPSAAPDDHKAGIRLWSHLGGDGGTLYRSELGGSDTIDPAMWAPTPDAKLGTTRTELYTAGDVGWAHWGSLGKGGDEDPSDDILRKTYPMKPGEQKVDWLSGPVSVNVVDYQFPGYAAGAKRLESDGDQIMWAFMPMFSSGDDTETLVSGNYKGEAILSRDGKELGRDKSDGTSAFIEVPKDDKGRYELTLDAERDAAWTPFGTKSKATWTFDSQPVGQAEEVPYEGFSVVDFDAEGIVNGYAVKHSMIRSYGLK